MFAPTTFSVVRLLRAFPLLLHLLLSRMQHLQLEPMHLSLPLRSLLVKEVQTICHSNSNNAKKEQGEESIRFFSIFFSKDSEFRKQLHNQINRWQLSSRFAVAFG
jgi:hypothetical protein